MPELPEVETIRRQLGPRLIGHRIVESDAHPSAKFSPATDAVGRQVREVGRRGKYLLVDLGDREMVVHLGMTGQLRLLPEPSGDRYVRAWWQLDRHGVLEFRDVRRFGRLAVVSPGDYAGLPTLHTMGPEPFDDRLTDERFWHLLRASSQHVKTKLLSQRPIAGVGNIYADEALFLSGIRPTVRSVSRARASALLAALRDVLAQGIDNGGTTLRDYRSIEGAGSNQFALSCYGRAGEPCVRCGTALRRSIVDGRSTTWCATCQTR